MQWYYEKNREQRGRVEESELKQLFESGHIDSSNLVWCKEMDDWATYGSVFGAAGPVAAVPVASEFKGTGGNTPNAELRAQARMALSGSWGMAALAVFLWQVVQGAAGMVPLLGPFAQLAIGGAMMIGLYGFFMQVHRGGAADVGVLFQGFSQFWSALGIYLLVGFLVFVASLAVAIPGIGILIYVGETSSVPNEEHPLFFVGIVVALVPFFVVCMIMTLRYMLVYFIKRDEPELVVTATLRRSAEMMKGRKWKLFALSFSFIGWHFLGMMALFIGLLWSCAYMFAAFAAFYDDLKES